MLTLEPAEAAAAERLLRPVVVAATLPQQHAAGRQPCVLFNPGTWAFIVVGCRDHPVSCSTALGAGARLLPLPNSRPQRAAQAVLIRIDGG